MASHPEPWPAGPAQPLLGEGAVHVWRAELDSVEGGFVELLSSEERARAERLLGERHRARWISARGVLRALLGHYLDADPSGLRLLLGPHGKPALDPPALAFNLSHAGGLALYALASAGAVGIDVELPRASTHDVLAIAARVLGERETARLRDLQPPEREHEFLKAWTRHEAALKHRGLGFATHAGLSQPLPWIGDLPLGPLGGAALAADREPRELRCWAWPPVRPV